MRNGLVCSDLFPVPIKEGCSGQSIQTARMLKLCVREYSIGPPSGYAAWRRPWQSRIFRISGSHKSRYSQKLTARPVPIVLSHRDEAIDVSHARIRAPIGKLPFYVTHGCHVFTTAPAASPLGGALSHPGFSGFPAAINPGRIDLCRGDRYQSSCLAETKRLTYHTPGSERRSETCPFT
ncbi:hypothetical protein DdX_03600 [Ditylenchus destructor]|uniref:Uncharacterized protein n=1 Tax=Ditylenchus destructor TaxID=166010 RepID=A0AAD4NCT1_9BILA|nr:hypothetical protein DdX_03600 [Ditylenchus destructor]